MAYSQRVISESKNKIMISNLSEYPVTIIENRKGLSSFLSFETIHEKKEKKKTRLENAPENYCNQSQNFSLFCDSVIFFPFQCMN